jgi:energy-coupling factor transport system substrate-specific component
MDSLGLSRGVDARVVAAAGVMLAVVFVMTRSVTFNIGPGGYIHTGDIAIYVAAFLFGPLVGLVSGAAGTSLADVSLGYGNWAPASYIGWRGGLPRLILAVIVGGAIVVVGYFLYMLVFIPLDVLEGEEGKTAIAVAWAAVWPNTFQVALAAVVAVPLVYAVQRAYPPILRWGAGPTWVDESANPPR